MPTKKEDSPPSPDQKSEHRSLIGRSDGKQRKVFTVNDPDLSGHKVRVKMALPEVNIQQVPDSYRKNSSMYPRSWYSVQMQLSPSSRGSTGRFLEERDEAGAEEDAREQVGTTVFKVPMLEGRACELKLPGLGKRARRKDEQIT